jgi:ATP-dependent helicase/DNAse subunit B
VLELATDRTLDAEDQRAAILAVLEDAFREAENDDKVRLPDYDNWELQADEHLKTIRRSVESKAFIGEGDRIIAAEKEFRTTWRGLVIRGTIDRVDETPDGLVAIDYKTSSVAPKGAKDEDGNLKLDVQIPIYASVALSELYPDKVVGQSKYYSLTKGKNLTAARDNATDGVVRLIDRLKQRLAAGAFPIDPDRKNDACKYCEFDSVCRRSQRLERKTWNDLT